MKKRIFSIIYLLVLIFTFVCSAIPVSADSGPSVRTTLSDNIIQHGSKKTFDVWATNSKGDKIKATVKLNNQKVEPTWDDNEKTSYTLIFTKEGENIVTVSASSDGGKKVTLTYHITYQKANPGDKIGTATWSVEAFTIGCGYLIYPVEVPIYEGETAAEQLIHLLHNNGLVGYYGGNVKSAFYLAYIADGTSTLAKFNNYQKSGNASNPKKLNLSPAIPSMLVPHLQDTMTFYDPQDYAKNWKGYLGEFAFTNGSGWMYSVNNIFPNVGFADSYLSDGDIVRVQFTLGYGADIGGFGAMGTEIPDVDTQPTSGYYAVANKDLLNKAIAKSLVSGLLKRNNVKNAYASALSVMAKLNATQAQVDLSTTGLIQALANPDPVTIEPPTTDPSDSPDTSTPPATDTSKPPITTPGESSETNTESPETSTPDNSDDASEESGTSPSVTDPGDKDILNPDQSTGNKTDETTPCITTPDASTSSADDKENLKKNSTVIVIAVVAVVAVAVVVIVIQRKKATVGEKGKKEND